MDDSTIERIALQLAEAFGAAFPQSKMAQPQPESQTVAVVKAPETPPCGHAISPRLKTQNPHLCPTCQITSHVAAIMNVQRQIFSRGGIFESREMAHGHKTVRQRWRTEKLRAIKKVTQFRILLNDAHLSENDKAEIMKAEQLWERKVPDLVLVPGVVYTTDVKEMDPSEEDHEVARLMIELLRLVLEKEMTKEDKEATSIPIRSKEKVRVGPSQQDHSIAVQGVPLPVSQPTPPTTPRSVLKRKISSESPTSSSHKRTRFIQVATVSPAHLNISNPSPFIKLPATVTIQPHRQETMATNKRHRSKFARSTLDYAPGVWASGAFEDKANTSYWKVDWDDAERMTKQEEREAQEEMAVLKALKVVSGAWMGLSWMQKVTQHVDLQKLQEDMRKT
jgi:hypothetical protein